MRLQVKNAFCFFVILFATLGDRDSRAAAPAASSSPAVVYTFDARPLNQLDLQQPGNAFTVWDSLHVLAALQGLANRDSPQLYLFYCSEFGVDTDQFWFDWLRAEDGWLKGREVRKLASLEEVVQAFRRVFKGLVVYDPAIPSTSNVASTAAGCEDLLPVRFDPTPGSVYSVLTGRLALPVRLWLVNPDGSSKFTTPARDSITGGPSQYSAKMDSYRWAINRYLTSRRCAPGIAAYYLDAFWIQHPRQAGPTMHTLSNHDYFVARRAFFFDLSPWGDELPGDDPTQPLGGDKAQFLELLRALYDHANGEIIKVGGFTPWPYKYTSHSTPPGKHDGVPTEWEFGRLISQFNGYMEADAAGLAAMANASFFQHYQLANRYPQPNPKPSMADWRRKGYLTSRNAPANKLFVGHYVGDYDAPSWMYKAVAAYFPDPERGRVPLGWAFDPNLADRAPQAIAYAYRHATSNDFFIAGDSGAGYLNPRGLTVRPDSGLPSGLERWTAHCRKYYDRWGMSITGFMLDGSAGASTDLEFAAYQTFSPDGAGTHFEPRPALHAGLPTCREQDLPDEVGRAAKLISDLARDTKDTPRFLWARSILKPPRWYSELARRVAETTEGTVEFVDPYTFFGLIRVNLTP
ncbi:MAG TPA: GxGYxYP domain-containing protein [Verrucomicrobiae bacterium]